MLGEGVSELRDTLRLQSNQPTKQAPHRHNKHQTKKVKQNSTQQTKERAEEVTVTKQKQTKRQVCEKHRSSFSFNMKRRKEEKRKKESKRH